LLETVAKAWYSHDHEAGNGLTTSAVFENSGDTFDEPMEYPLGAET
jgi:hypothetical protein